MADEQVQSNISINPAQAYLGLNTNSIIRQIKPGMLTYALNAQVENWDGNSITYQNEQGTEFCVNLPAGYKIVGKLNIIELGVIVVWLANPLTGGSEIGKIIDCTYFTLINDPCIGLSIFYPILKAVYKLTNCTTEIYWTDAHRGRRWMDLDNLPFKEIEGCPPIITGQVDCNKLEVQPNFAIPEIVVEAVRSDGDLTAGTYQFAVQYANAKGEEYTSYYSVTNPLPIFDPTKITQDFNFNVGKSIVLNINNLDTTGFYDFFNLAVIKTVNNITSVELVGTFDITGATKSITYTGQGKTDIRLTIDDIFEKFPIYKTAQDVTAVQDILVWAGVTTNERVNYQRIANQITLQWQTWRVPGDKAYAKELRDVYRRGYMRDEVYPFEIVFILKNGFQTDGFHIPSRTALPEDLVPVYNNDVIGPDETKCDENPQPRPRWQVYNTGCNLGKEPEFLENDQGDCYEGPYEYGCFAYWESTDTYPCDVEVWGDLANKPIRHHKFPDSLITHIHDSSDNIYPIGVKVDQWQIINLINNSNLTAEQKADIAGFKIVRGNRVNNKSVIAKGLINNVGFYQREGTTYLFPNYPYNDLRPDPFIVGGNNYDVTSGTHAHTSCISYTVMNTSPSASITVSYTSCPPNSIQQQIVVPASTTSATFCSLTYPTLSTATDGVIISGDPCGESGGSDGGASSPQDPLSAFSTTASLYRYAFHSPDTHFYQPSLGNIIKLETAEWGKTESHFVQVKKHSRYKFITNGAVITALAVGIGIGFASNTIGVSTNVFNGTAAYTAFKVFLDIINQTSPRKNFAYQYNSNGKYTNYLAVLNNGEKQRLLDIAAYASPGMLNIGDIHTLNNWQRESSVYLRTTKPLPFVSSIVGVPIDNSRFTLSDAGKCDEPGSVVNADISSYYAAIKTQFANQYGQIYSYETIDTGYQLITDITKVPTIRYASVFGGDIFINRFAFKNKLPFFIDNRVNFPDEADVEYNEIGNIAYPKYWFTTDIRQGGVFGLFGVKNTNFDCNDNTFFYKNGKFYLFAYGIPYFYVESEVNVDLRQAYNGSEGDFYPRVGSGIPDDWLQEINTTIQQDNTYWYNKTYSKQNKENFFSHLPANFSSDDCRRVFGYRAIYSEQQTDWVDGTSNKWLIYRPVSMWDFKDVIVAIDGIENKSVLVRYANSYQLYNVYLTVSTSNPKAAYLGNDTLFAGSPPIDSPIADIGYAGSQHKLLLKTEFGHVFADAKRGQVFLIRGNQAKDISGEGMSKFFTEFLNFEIKKAFPTINIDNHFNTVGLHGVFDSKYNRIVLTKIDYKPLVEGIVFEDNQFTYQGEIIELGDPEYFCNYSFTISYSFDIQAWVSFHSYIPNFYIGDANFFYSGVNSSNTALWRHNTSMTLYNNFYGDIHPYILEYPYSYQYNDEILQNIRDYTKVLQYTNWQSFIETDDIWFNKSILYNGQQCSGVLELVKKPQNNLSVYSGYPIYNSQSKTILYSKRDNFYQFNTFWGLNVDKRQPIWLKSCENLSIFKELNQANMSYTKRSFHKDTLRAKDLKCRFILDNRDDVKMISQFITAPTMKSYL